jgi:uncharacterized SAM-binding protein YcdF (DUF218 family)
MKARRLGWAPRITLAVVALVALATVIGFLRFVEGVQSATPPIAPRADAIVALTGGSRERLETGVQLLADGAGERLLITGVNPAVADETLFEVLAVEPELAECCIDLGRQAQDTLGNAAETAAWVRARSYRTLVVVTDDYHMPRSLAELRLAMPELAFIPYPVKTESGLGRMVMEYGKFVVVRARETAVALLAPARRAASAGAA